MDETVFIGADKLKNAWSQKNSHLNLELVGGQEEQSAKVIGALSNKGSYIYWASPDYFDRFDILKFVQMLERRNRGKNWAIFWDNCPTHKANIVKDYLGEKGVPIVFNLPYCPEYNGIESLWGFQKKKFRKLITEAKVNKEIVDVMKAVIRIQKECA